MMNKQLRLLVGDNPFHGISHLSQERARARLTDNANSSNYNANLVKLSLENGASGFMFSVDETTLSILKELNGGYSGDVYLYAIAPYAYEYVRKSTQTGGVNGLVTDFAKQMVFSFSNLKVLATNTWGILRFDLSALLKAYVTYELSRINEVKAKNMHLEAFVLHEIITDMALALNLKQLCQNYITFLENKGMRPGFETRNFPYLVDKFSEWGIDFGKLTLASSFNKVGFQMCPSQRECEEALERVKDAEVIAMSVLAAGYLKPAEAYGYVAGLDGISGFVIGVSKEHQAKETFKFFSSGNFV